MEQLQFFSSQEVVLFFDFFRRLVPFCRPAQRADLACQRSSSIISSKSGHSSSIGQYSIHHCRKGNVLPKLVVQDCDCSEPTSQLCSSRKHLATDSLLSPLTSAHHKKVVTMHQDVDLQDFLEEVTRRRRASGKAFLLQDMCIMFSPQLL